MHKQHTYISVVVLKTKHQSDLNLNAAAQAIGYCFQAKLSIVQELHC